MERIELSDATIRLRRNMLAISFLIPTLKIYQVKIEKFNLIAVSVSNFKMSDFYFVASILLIYHLVVFAIRSTEDYYHWSATTHETPGIDALIKSIGGGDLDGKVNDVKDLLRSSLMTFFQRLPYEIISDVKKIGNWKDSHNMISRLPINIKIHAPRIKKEYLQMRIHTFRFIIIDIIAPLIFTGLAILVILSPNDWIANFGSQPGSTP